MSGALLVLVFLACCTGDIYSERPSITYLPNLAMCQLALAAAEAKYGTAEAGSGQDENAGAKSATPLERGASACLDVGDQ